EALQFSALILVLRRWIPNFRTRMLVFGFLTVFLFNTLLGLNWNGIRRLLPLAAILCAASVPSSMARLLAAASLCGLSMAYSPDLGIPCLIAVMSVHVIGYFKTRDLNCLGSAGVFVAASCAVWLAVIGLLLGRTLSAYVQAAWYVIQRFSAGEAGFPF